MQTCPARADREPAGLRRLAARFLRMAPDVAIVGEVRDRGALPRLRAPRFPGIGVLTVEAASAEGDGDSSSRPPA
jgi:pilus assembly protein CpaF